MQNKMRRRRHNLILWSLAVVLLLTSFFDAFSSVGLSRHVFADTAAERAGAAEQLLTKCREALNWKMKASGAKSEQALLDMMAAHAGRSPEDWYVLAMAKMGLKLDYIKLKPDGTFHEIRFYDKDHYLRYEIAYHPEPSLDPSRKPVLHFHKYDRQFNCSGQAFL